MKPKYSGAYYVGERIVRTEYGMKITLVFSLRTENGINFVSFKLHT